MGFFKEMNAQSENKVKEIQGEAAEKVKCLIVGSGPAGYTAAIYAARANLEPVIFEGLQPGGQLTTTTTIENFPGYPSGVSGMQMMDELKAQAQRFGADIRGGLITKVDFSCHPHKVLVDDEKIIAADTVIVSTGANALYLGLESEKKFAGFGVSACATCDGFFYKNQDVAVVGGGDTACEEAVYLSGLCRKVTMIVRKNYLRASQIMQNKVASKPNIEILFEHTVKEIVGDQAVNGVIVTNAKGEELKLAVTGFFLAIGHHPNSELFKDYLEVDEHGYIKTIPGTSKTNIPGVFACGDVQDPQYKQAITAAGSGCMAAIDAERYYQNLKK